MCLKGVLIVSVRCLEGFQRVSKECLEGSWRGSVRCCGTFMEGVWTLYDWCLLGMMRVSGGFWKVSNFLGQKLSGTKIFLDPKFFGP